MDEPVVAISSLRKVYQVRRGLFRRVAAENSALDGIDLVIERGQLFGLLGPNGAGKTTAVKILTTILLPTSGTVRVLGHDVVRDASLIRHRIGFLFGGERGLYWRISGLDNLRYFADLYQIPPQVARARIASLLEALGLLGREHERVETYSRGMKQRLHIARALLNDPEVVFLDEPTMGLDPIAARELRILIRDLADQGKTIFLTTHNMFEADAICDRIAVVTHGNIVANGTPGSLKRLAEDVGVVEFQISRISAESLRVLRALPSVRSVSVVDNDLKQVVSVQCAVPADLLGSLAQVVGNAPIMNLQLREPTLEDAYVRLVSK